MFSALIIDADEAANASIRDALAPYGFEFTATQDASEAMNLAKTATPDIIFLRVELPNVSGFSVCNKLRRNDETKYIPLVMYASDVSTDVFDQHRNLKTHADDYLKLPFTAEQLVTSVGGLIELPEPGSVELAAPSEPPPPVAPDEEAIEVLLDEPEPESPGETLEMAEFENEFAQMEEPSVSPVTTAPESPASDLGEEMEAAFDGLINEPEPEPEPEPAVEAAPEPEPSPPPPSEPPPAPEPAEAMPETAMDPESPSSSAAAGGGKEFKAQREVIQLKSQVNSKNREILSLKDELEDHMRAVLDAKHRGRELQAQLGDVEEKLLAAEERVITAQEQADAANRDKNTVLKREEGLKLRLEGTQNKLKDLETQLESARREAVDAQQGEQKKIAALHRELESAETDLATARQEVDDIRESLESMQLQCNELNTALGNETSKNEELIARIAQQQSESQQLRDELEASQQTAATDLQVKLDEAMQGAQADKAAALAAQSKEHQAEIEFGESQHRSELERVRGELEQAQQQLSQAQSAEQALRQQSQSTIGSLEDELNGARGQLQTAQTELESRRSNEHRAQQALAVALRVLDGQPTP